MGPILTPAGAGVRATVGTLAASASEVGVGVGGSGVAVLVGVEVAVGEGVAVGGVVGVAVGGKDVAVAVGGREVEVAVGGGVAADGAEGGMASGSVVIVAAWVSSTIILIAVGDGLGFLRAGVTVGTVGVLVVLPWLVFARREALPGVVKRRLASQPPISKAVMASQINIEILARRARLASSSLTIGKIALWASRLERKATIAAMMVAPTLSAARMSKMVGKAGILETTPRSQFAEVGRQ